MPRSPDPQLADTLELDPQSLEKKEDKAPLSEATRVLPETLRTRYEHLRLIGEGAMGTVFRGWDPQLGRAVALKLLKGDDPEDTRRFLQEAKAQARIQHDNVCRVYDAGMADGEPYIAMELIDGVSLDRAKAKMSLEQKVKVVREVAAALHEAHRLGVIHRDIKPSNIMIMTNDDGTLKPYVVDFGLAREISSSGQTMNMIVGTPAYMSPEQAEGSSAALDRRSDVYSLGVTLYELLAGRTPFIGSTAVAILTKVMLDDAPSLRGFRRGIPPELETIVMTCLARDPAKRYESARALGEDLQRFLDGEPIQAKRASLAYVLRAKARKNKPAVFIAMIGFCVTIVLTGMWVRAGQRASEQARLGRELGEDVKYMELFLRSAYGLPAHDIERENRVVRARLENIKRRMADAGRAGEGPGHYALGRGHLALHDNAEAKKHLELSLASGYERSEVHYALGLALGELYQSALDETRRIADKKAREAAVQRAREAYRDPAVSHLRASGDTEVESKLYIDGLVALYEGRYDDAAAQAIAATNDSPWLYEAKKLEGDARLEAGIAAVDRGQSDEGRRLLSLAVEAYKVAASMASSDANIHEALAEAWLQLLQVDPWGQRFNRAAFEAALAACDDAIRSRKNNSNAYSKKGRAHLRVGEYQVNNGEDPRPTLRLAIENGNTAKSISPDDALSDDAVGMSYTTIALYERKVGLDPLPSLKRAMDSFDEATRIQPTFAWAWNDAGLALTARADYENDKGIDPRPAIDEAIARYTRAATEDPTYTAPLANLALVLTVGANYEFSQGRDPRKDTSRAAEACARGLKINPESIYCLNNGAWAELVAAQYEEATGADPTQALSRVEASFEASLAINKGTTDTHFGIGAAEYTRALYLLRKGEDPQNAFDKARVALSRAAELDKQEPLIRLELGRLVLTIAQRAMARGEDTAALMGEAERVLREGLQINPRHARLHAALAKQFALRAERDKAPDKLIERGLAAAEEALAQNPKLAVAAAVKGTLYALRARAATNKSRAEDARLAVEWLERAFATNPALSSDFKDKLNEARTLIDTKTDAGPR